MFGLLPLLFALTIAETSTHAKTPLAPLTTWTALLTAVGVSLLVWLVLGETAARIIATGGRRRWLSRWDLAVQGLILGWYAWVCYGWGWSANAGFFTLALAPWLLMQAVHWWTLAVAVRRVSGHHWSRFGLVLQHFRFGILPMLLILPFFDVSTWIAQRYGLEAAWFSGAFGALLAALCAQAGMVLILMVLPLALLPLWGARRMPSGEMQRLMSDACSRLGVRVAGLMRWPMAGGRVYNAAVIGMLPRLRYVLFTDDLMRDLPVPQVMAVLGHELGHARHGHLWIYLLFANAGLLVSFLLREDFAAVLLPLLKTLLPTLGLALDDEQLRGFAEISAILLMMALLWRVAFGVLSRACERQADLVGAELAGDPQVMCDALKSVAHLSGQGEDEPSWRHYTIAQRVAFLQAVRRHPSLAVWHHKFVLMMRHSLILIILTLLLALSYILEPGMDSVRDPQQAVNAWIQRDRDLGIALQAADNGQHMPLATWLNRLDEIPRQRFARITIRQVEIDIGVDKDGDQRFDDRPIYRWRHRLMAFQEVTTGDSQIDHMIDNSLAYGLVAGTENPTATDLTIARSVLPRLIKKAAEQKSDHALQDTIGCVHFALGEYANAVTAFELVMTRFTADTALTNASWLTSEADKRKMEKIHTHMQSLYSRRLDAARINAAKVAAGARPDSPDMLPLPRDLGQVLPPSNAPIAPVEAGATGIKP
jgi:Zn-dependent protease with chaperone function